MKRKTIILIIGAIAVAALLGGCQRGNAKNKGEARTEVEETEEIDKDSEESEPEGNFSEEWEEDDDDEYVEPEATRTMSLVEARSRVESLADDFHIWEYEYLYVLSEEDEGEINFRRDDFERTRAAALAIDVSHLNFDMLDSGDRATVTLSDSDVIDSAHNFFGRDPVFESLNEDDPFIIRHDDGGSSHAIRFIYYYEDEGTFNVNDWDLFEEGNGYRLDQKLYCGYWGAFDGSNSNYKVSFHLEESSKSKYGLVITSMNYRKTDSDARDELSDSDYSPFYGVWCGALKEESDAQLLARKLSESGYVGSVFCCSDWSNMSNERRYAVTAGVYYNEEAAESALIDVKALGYKDAYVKYSGDYRGNN